MAINEKTENVGLRYNTYYYNNYYTIALIKVFIKRLKIFIEIYKYIKLHQTPNTKHQTPNTKHQTLNTKHQTTFI